MSGRAQVIESRQWIFRTKIYVIVYDKKKVIYKSLKIINQSYDIHVGQEYGRFRDPQVGYKNEIKKVYRNYH